MMRCVNALNGLSSFLRTVARYRTWNRLGVNALNGLSSFLPKNIMTEKMAQEMCQRPKRAFFISTVIIAVGILMSMLCVNALNGLSSFLHC